MKAVHSQTSSTIGPPYLSVVFPVYQEQEVIERVIMTTIEVLKSEPYTFEVIAVNDGSTDGTKEILTNLQAKYSSYLRVLQHPYNKGNGATVKTGIQAARGEIIACMDADGQHDPHDLYRMLPYMSEYDLVVGARTWHYQGAWHRKLANKLYNGLGTWLTQFPIEDLTSGYRLFKGSVVKQYVHLFPARFSYPTTSTLVFIKSNYNVKYVSINVRPRQGSNSKINPMYDGWRFLIIIFKIIVIFEPLKVFLPTALGLFFLAAISTAYSIWSLGRLHIPNSSVILFTIGVLVVLLGLIAEQIAVLQVSTHSRND